jgi:ABC-2 type transport system permease protein
MRLFASIYKEFLLLLRDRAGLALMFLMPLVLVVVITIIQDDTFRIVNNSKVSLILVNNDQGDIGKAIEKSIEESKSFSINTSIEDRPITAKMAEGVVASGDYKIGIVLPEGLSTSVRQQIKNRLSLMLADHGLGEKVPDELEPLEILIYFDPVTRKAFKDSIRNSIERIIFQIESRMVYKILSAELSESNPEATRRQLDNTDELVRCKEIVASNSEREIIPNSVQHNVPAWTMFAMFFIVISLSGNIINEKTQGSSVRLRTIPGTSSVVLAAKLIIYTIVCLVQFGLMLMVGIFFMPMIGLPTLVLGTDYFPMIAVALFSALAATGYGVAVGSIASSQEQASTFGAISVIILAALGGIWVPVFAMPSTMQFVSKFSPLNWGLTAFYDIFLRNSGFSTIFPQIIKMFLFFIFTMAVGYLYNKHQNTL